MITINITTTSTATPRAVEPRFPSPSFSVSAGPPLPDLGAWRWIGEQLTGTGGMSAAGRGGERREARCAPKQALDFVLPTADSTRSGGLVGTSPIFSFGGRARKAAAGLNSKQIRVPSYVAILRRPWSQNNKFPKIHQDSPRFAVKTFKTTLR